MRVPHALAAAGLVWLITAVVVPGAVRAQGGAFQGLSPEAIDDLIASARPDVPATLTFANREITVLRAATVGRTPAERVYAIRALVAELAADGRHLDVTRRALGAASVISAGGRDVFAIVPADTDPLLGETVEAKAEVVVARLRQALDETAEATRPQVLLWALVQALLATFAFGLALWTLLRANRWAAARVERTTGRQLSRSAVGDEIVRQTRVLDYIRRSVTAALVIVALSFAYIWLFFVLRRFPYTRPWGESLRAYLVDRAIRFGQSIAVAIPDLFTIVLIIVVTRLAIRLLRLLFVAVEQERLTLPWVYPETAATTRKLVTGLLWLFALVVCYPYLPGSETDAFKGVSVFVGLMVSIGSSGIVNQVMSGFTVTYSRALRPGDYVRVGEVEGTVSQVGTLSTKIETPRHEEVTIPNAVLIVAGRDQLLASRGCRRLRADRDHHRLRCAVATGRSAAAARGEPDLRCASRSRTGRSPDGARRFLRSLHAARVPRGSASARAHSRPVARQHSGCLQRAGRPDHVAELRGRPECTQIVPKEHWFATVASTREPGTRA